MQCYCERCLTRNRSGSLFSRKSIQVIDASAVFNLPLAGGSWAEEVTLEGRDAAPGGTPIPAEVNAVTPRYFHTMGIPLLAGRDFTERDRGAFWLGDRKSTRLNSSHLG